MLLKYWLKRKAIVLEKKYELSSNSIHVHLLIIFEEFQGQGLGRDVMLEIHKNARNTAKLVKLSCFKINTKAVSFYQSLGYSVFGEDEYFYDFEFDPQSRSVV